MSDGFSGRAMQKTQCSPSGHFFSSHRSQLTHAKASCSEKYTTSCSSASTAHFGWRELTSSAVWLKPAP